MSEVLEQKRPKMNDTTVLQPAMADAELPAEPTPEERTIEPLDLIEEPKVRTKLRIYTILAALYVYNTYLSYLSAALG